MANTFHNEFVPLLVTLWIVIQMYFQNHQMDMPMEEDTAESMPMPMPTPMPMDTQPV